MCTLRIVALMLIIALIDPSTAFRPLETRALSRRRPSNAARHVDPARRATAAQRATTARGAPTPRGRAGLTRTRLLESDYVDPGNYFDAVHPEFAVALVLHWLLWGYAPRAIALLRRGGAEDESSRASRGDAASASRLFRRGVRDAALPRRPRRGSSEASATRLFRGVAARRYDFGGIALFALEGLLR